MDKSSRVWVYQSNRIITSDESELIERRLRKFVDTWAAHGQDLVASFEIKHNLFIVLSVNEANHAASGCSIDSSVHIIKELGNELAIDFFDRSTVAFLNKDKVYLYQLNQIKGLILDGLIDENSITFNNLVQDIASFEKSWCLPAKESWLKRYFSAQTA